MAWYNGDIKDNHHVMWSRVRIYRNVQGMEFSPIWDHKKAVTVMNKAAMLLEKTDFITLMNARPRDISNTPR